MNSPMGKVLDEGNCKRATVGGEEACEDVRKRRVCGCLLVSSGSLSPPGLLHVKSARLRTETSYQAGSGGRVSTTSRSRSQLPDQVKGEPVQRKFTLLSGETCQRARVSSFAPASKHHRLKGWNRWKQSHLGEAGVSRGRSTELSIPTRTGRTEQ